MRLTRSIQGLLLSSCILLAVSGTGFASWCFMANERKTDLPANLTITDFSTEGSIKLKSSICDPFITYDRKSFDVIRSHSTNDIKNKSHYIDFVYTPKDPVYYEMVSDIEVNGKDKVVPVYSLNKYVFHEEVWIPRKTLDYNGLSLSLANTLILQPDAKRGDKKFRKVEEGDPLYQRDFDVYSLDVGPVDAKYMGNYGVKDCAIEDGGKGLRFSVYHTFTFNPNVAVRDYTSVTDPNNKDPNSLPLMLDERTYSCFVKLLNEPDNQIRFRVSAETIYNTWDPQA